MIGSLAQSMTLDRILTPILSCAQSFVGGRDSDAKTPSCDIHAFLSELSIRDEEVEEYCKKSDSAPASISGHGTDRTVTPSFIIFEEEPLRGDGIVS